VGSVIRREELEQVGACNGAAVPVWLAGAESIQVASWRLPARPGRIGHGGCAEPVVERDALRDDVQLQPEDGFAIECWLGCAFCDATRLEHRYQATTKQHFDPDRTI
jgi:hypothetical protein